MGLPIDLPCLLTLSYLSLIHLSCQMYCILKVTSSFIPHIGLWCHRGYQVIAQSSLEKLRRYLGPCDDISTLVLIELICG